MKFQPAIPVTLDGAPLKPELDVLDVEVQDRSPSRKDGPRNAPRRRSASASRSTESPSRRTAPIWLQVVDLGKCSRDHGRLRAHDAVPQIGKHVALAEQPLRSALIKNDPRVRLT